jgi:hypothetical protein
MNLQHFLPAKSKDEFTAHATRRDILSKLQSIKERPQTSSQGK